MKVMKSSPELFVVRIYGKQEVVGAGFLVSDEYILTCAHVVAEALGNNNGYSKQKPSQEQEVKLDFPIIKTPNNKPIEPLTAKVEFWLPANDHHFPEDIAVLKLIQSPPKKAQAAVLSMTQYQLDRHKFGAYGFPPGKDHAVWAEGVITKRVGQGRIQLNGLNTQYSLKGGFSGTPIWDKNLGAVVGIAVSAEKLQPDVKAAFMIPTELLLKAWDKLLEVCSLDSRISSLIGLLEPYFEDCKFEDFKYQIEIAYKKSLPQLAISNFPDSIAEIVRSLDTRENDSEDDCSCLEKFVGYLLLSLKNSDLKGKLHQLLTNWLNSYLGDERREDLLGLLKSKEQREKLFNENKKPCLIAAIFEDNNFYTVEGWLIEDVRNYQPIEEAGCYCLTDESNKKITDRKLSNLREIINLFIDKSISHCLQNIAKIQFFLPPKLIFNNLECLYSLILNPERYFKQTINAEYEISIRLSPRLRGAGKDLIVKWFNKGGFLIQQQMQPAVNIVKNQNCSVPNELFNELDSPNIVAVRLNKVIQKSKLEWVIAAFLETGIPLALWMRKEIEGLNCCQALEEICQDCCLEELSENIKNRSRTTPHIGNCLSLLWDDPTLVPPKYAPEYVLKMS